MRLGCVQIATAGGKAHIVIHLFFFLLLKKNNKKKSRLSFTLLRIRMAWEWRNLSVLTSSSLKSIFIV